MQAFVKEGGGGDHISVGVKLPDGKMERPIQNANLFVGPNGAFLTPQVFFMIYMYHCL